MKTLFTLTERVLVGSLRTLDLPFGVIVPVVTLIGFNVALHNLIDTGGMTYLQYVLPAVVVQAMLFGALTTTDRAVEEQVSGFGSRLRTLPMSPLTPLAARMVYCLIRGLLAVVAALATAYVLGFRMQSGFGHLTAFVLLSLTLTLALSLGADAMGTHVKRSVAGQFLFIPQLLLVLLSTGLAPVESFPTWLHLFVRYQPVSQITETLRGLTSGHLSTANVLTSLAWCSGLLAIFGALAIRLQRRKL